jgi:hypothetical protein
MLTVPFGGASVAKFNISKIVPEGFMHHSAFDEIIESLSWSLSSLGHEVNCTQNWLSEQKEHNIIFGAELIADYQRLPSNTTIFNLEQPSHPNMEKVRRIAKESNCAVWDYSSRAVEEWKSFGHDNVEHVPIGYTPNLTRIPKVENQDIDVLFYGWLTPRRISLLDELQRHGLNVVSTAACYGGGRDNLISRSKIVLNVHHDGRDRFEIVRCSYLMANSSCIVTEDSSDDEDYRDLHGLYPTPYRGIVDRCVSLCKSEGQRRSMENLAYSTIRQRDFASTVAMVLEPVSTRAEFHESRLSGKREFMKKARALTDSRVGTRFSAASLSGDMKDFVSWMRDNAKGNIVEIGVRDGASTSAFLSGVEKNGGHVYSIDVQPCGGLYAGHPQWSFLQANSTDINKVIRFIPFEIDVLLIDGDHSRAGVIADFEYARQVRAGGIVLFHDIDPEKRPSGCADMSWPGDDVKNVYNELCEALAPMGWTHEELPGRYGMGVLRKPPMVPPKQIEVEQELAK